MRHDTLGHVYNTGSKCCTARLWPPQLQFWRDAIKVSNTLECRCTVVCLGLICVYMNRTVCFGVLLWCDTQVFTLALGLGLPSLACWQQLESVSRCELSSVLFGSLATLPLAPNTAVAWPTEQRSVFVCVCVCVFSHLTYTEYHPNPTTKWGHVRKGVHYGWSSKFWRIFIVKTWFLISEMGFSQGRD